MKWNTKINCDIAAENSCCCIGPTGPTGPTGSIGPTGPTGINYSDYLFWDTTLTPAAWNVGDKQVHIGGFAGEITQGQFATAIGYNAGTNNQGESSIAIGNFAGQTNQGQDSIAIGTIAGRYNQGEFATAIGYNAGTNNQEVNAIAIGFSAGNNTQEVNAIAIGTAAGQTNQEVNAIAIGTIAGQTNQGKDSIAIGTIAGQTNQGQDSIAIGYVAGQTNQGQYATALGFNAGNFNQGLNAIAIGINAGITGQGINAIAIGTLAGRYNQGNNAIAIGNRAGITDQANNTIILNATGSDLNTPISATGSFYVAPIRGGTGTTNFLYYDTPTQEILYSSTGSSTGPGPNLIPSGFTGSAQVNIPLGATGPTGVSLGSCLMTQGITGYVWGTASATFTNDGTDNYIINMSISVDGTLSNVTSSTITKELTVSFNSYLNMTVHQRSNVMIGPQSVKIEAFAYSDDVTGNHVKCTHCDIFGIGNLS